MISIFNQIVKYEKGLLVLNCEENQLNVLTNHPFTASELWQQFWVVSQSEQKLKDMLKSKSSAHENQLEAYVKIIFKISEKIDKTPLVGMINQFVDKIALEHKLWPEQLLKLIWEGFYITEATLDKNYQEKDCSIGLRGKREKKNVLSLICALLEVTARYPEKHDFWQV